MYDSKLRCTNRALCNLAGCCSPPRGANTQTTERFLIYDVTYATYFRQRCQNFLRHFEEHGLRWENMCVIWADGAPAMLGAKIGFKKLVQDRAPKPVPLHCMQESAEEVQLLGETAVQPWFVSISGVAQRWALHRIRTTENFDEFGLDPDCKTLQNLSSGPDLDSVNGKEMRNFCCENAACFTFFYFISTWTLHLKKFLDCGWTWTEFQKSGMYLDRKIWQSAHL